MSDLEMEVARDAGRRSSVWRRSSLVSDVELRDEKREDDDARLNVASRLRDLFLVDPADGKIVREDLPRPATPRTFGNHVQCHDTDKNEEPPAKLPRIRAASQVETEEGSLFGLVRRASRVFSSRCDRGEHTAQESDANLTEVGRENSARTMDTTTASWRQPLAPQRFFAGPIMALAKGEPPKQEALETEGALHQQLVQLEGMGEYSEDVYDYLFTVQALVPSDFLARSKITAFRRSQMIAYLFDVYIHLRPRFSVEAAYLAVYLIDKTLSTGTVEPSDVELLVLTSLFLAGKLDSQVTHLPSLIRNKYPLPAIRSMEKTILEATSFRLGVTTILHFMIVLVGHREDVDQTVWQLAKYIGCIAMCDDALASFVPSLVGGIVFCLACRLSKLDWTETMYTLSKHTMTEYTWPYMRLCSCVLEAITNPVMKPITAFYSNKTRLSVAIFDSFKMEYLRKRASQANS